MNQMKALAILATLGGSLAAGSAMAGGINEPTPDPVVAPVVTQAAPYTGGDWTGFYAGAQLGYVDVDSNDAGLDGNDVLIGVHGGYRYDFGRAVIGAELDYDFADVDLGDNLGSLDEVGRVKLMAGADLGRTLVYGTAGYAHAKATVGGSDLSGDGAFGGFGVDYALNTRMTVGGEVLFHSFDDFDDTGVDLDATTATVRVGFQF
jgi:outer membrane immunogenic protein